MASIAIANTPTIAAQTFLTGEIASTNPSVTYAVNYTGITLTATGEILEFPNYSTNEPAGPVVGQIWPLNFSVQITG